MAKYENIVEGVFLERLNRFLAKVDIYGHEKLVHVKNTGRLRELLIPGAIVYLEDHRKSKGNRKTEFSLIAVEKKQKLAIKELLLRESHMCSSLHDIKAEDNVMLVNIDSQVPNKVVFDGLTDGHIQLPGMETLIEIRREVTFGSSRFDFFVKDDKGKRAFIEVKGVTLETDGVAAFPDAPTERGLKHVMELSQALEEGFRCYIIFLIQMRGINLFTPNDITHQAFGDGLRYAANRGVIILAYDSLVTPDSIVVGKTVRTQI